MEDIQVTIEEKILRKVKLRVYNATTNKKYGCVVDIEGLGMNPLTVPELLDAAKYIQDNSEYMVAEMGTYRVLDEEAFYTIVRKIRD